MFKGAKDPDNREILWNNLDINSEIYKFMKVLNTVRTLNKTYSFDRVER